MRPNIQYSLFLSIFILSIVYLKPIEENCLLCVPESTNHTNVIIKTTGKNKPVDFIRKRRENLNYDTLPLDNNSIENRFYNYPVSENSPRNEKFLANFVNQISKSRSNGKDNDNKKSLSIENDKKSSKISDHKKTNEKIEQTKNDLESVNFKHSKIFNNKNDSIRNRDEKLKTEHKRKNEYRKFIDNSTNIKTNRKVFKENKKSRNSFKLNVEESQQRNKLNNQSEKSIGEKNFSTIKSKISEKVAILPLMKNNEKTEIHKLMTALTNTTIHSVSLNQTNETTTSKLLKNEKEIVLDLHNLFEKPTTQQDSESDRSNLTSQVSEKKNPTVTQSTTIKLNEIVNHTEFLSDFAILKGKALDKSNNLNSTRSKNVKEKLFFKNLNVGNEDYSDEIERNIIEDRKKYYTARNLAINDHQNNFLIDFLGWVCVGAFGFIIGILIGLMAFKNN